MSDTVFHAGVDNYEKPESHNQADYKLNVSLETLIMETQSQNVRVPQRSPPYSRVDFKKGRDRQNYAARTNHQNDQRESSRKSCVRGQPRSYPKAEWSRSADVLRRPTSTESDRRYHLKTEGKYERSYREQRQSHRSRPSSSGSDGTYLREEDGYAEKNYTRSVRPARYTPQTYSFPEHNYRDFHSVPNYAPRHGYAPKRAENLGVSPGFSAVNRASRDQHEQEYARVLRMASENSRTMFILMTISCLQQLKISVPEEVVADMRLRSLILSVIGLRYHLLQCNLSIFYFKFFLPRVERAQTVGAATDVGGSAGSSNQQDSWSASALPDSELSQYLDPKELLGSGKYKCVSYATKVTFLQIWNLRPRDFELPADLTNSQELSALQIASREVSVELMSHFCQLFRDTSVADDILVLNPECMNQIVLHLRAQVGSENPDWSEEIELQFSPVHWKSNVLPRLLTAESQESLAALFKRLQLCANTGSKALLQHRYVCWPYFFAETYWVLIISDTVSRELVWVDPALSEYSRVAKQFFNAEGGVELQSLHRVEKDLLQYPGFIELEILSYFHSFIELNQMPPESTPPVWRKAYVRGHPECDVTTLEDSGVFVIQYIKALLQHRKVAVYSFKDLNIDRARRSLVKSIAAGASI